MSSWLEAKVIENRRWTEALFSLRVALAEGAPRLAFEAGQFVRIALDIAGVFAVLILLSVLGVALHLIMQALQKRLIFWSEPEQVIGA